MPTTRDQIVDTARKYLHVPWVHQGRNKHGLDCVGLLFIVARDLGIELRDVTGYTKFYNPKTLTKKFHESNCKEVPLNKLIAGDIVVVNVGRAPLHVGILSMKNGTEHIIHSIAALSHVREEPVDFLMRKKFHTGFSFPGV